MIRGEVLLDLNKINKTLSQSNHELAMLMTLNSQVLPDMTNYVPLDQDSLRMSGHIEGHDTLVWDTPYAKVQYLGTAGKPKGVWSSDKQRKWYFANLRAGTLPKKGYTTPGTGPFWDEVAKGHHLDDWIAVYVEMAGYR